MNIRVLITRDGSNKIAVMPLEEYLKGVVPSEMPTRWHNEAYKAQAVAARTYALNKINRHINKTYDVDDTTNYQAYKTYKINEVTDRAVFETCGHVLYFDGKVLKECLYSSSNGGHCYSITEYGRWGSDDIPYLVSKDDPFTKEEKNGHGVGMSQHGAQDRALAGQTYKEILAFYYSNTYIVNLYEQEKNGVDEMDKLLPNQYVKFMEKNRCYIQGVKMKPKGIMVHSTGVGATPASQWFNRWNTPDVSKAVHAFLDDKEIWQYLPWDICGWHAGGIANRTHIGFEICEPQGNLFNDEYFEKAYTNAIKLSVHLCKIYGLSSKDILSHAEGHRHGIASNHADVGHWFPYMGKSIDDFRAEVDEILNEPKEEVINPVEPIQNDENKEIPKNGVSEPDEVNESYDEDDINSPEEQPVDKINKPVNDNKTQIPFNFSVGLLRRLFKFIMRLFFK